MANIRIEFTRTEAQWVSSLLQGEMNQLSNAISNDCGDNETAKNILRAGSQPGELQNSFRSTYLRRVINEQ